MTDILSEGGMCAINTIIKSEKKKKSIFQQIDKVKNTTKFKSKCTEDANEVVFLVKPVSDTSSPKSRLTNL